MFTFCLIMYILVGLGVFAHTYIEEKETVVLSIVFGLVWPSAVGYMISKNAG